MITKFREYIVESRKSIDELEILTPDELGKLLIDESSKKSPDVQFIQDLLDIGAPIDAMDDLGLTALHKAAYRRHRELVKFLLSRGARVDIKDCMGLTAWNCGNKELRANIPELNPNR